MSFTYDTSNNIGKVRALTGDTNGSNVFVEDEQITVFLNLSDDDVRLAAADCCEVMATNHVNLLKCVSLLDLKTDGAAMAEALMARAKSLRTQASEYDAGFDVAEVVINDFGYREMITKLLVQGG